MNPKETLRIAKLVLGLLHFKDSRLFKTSCPLCGSGFLLRLNRTEMGLRCVRCKASAVHMSIGSALQNLGLELSGVDAFEMSSRGPLVKFLGGSCRSLQVSEFWPNIEPGSSYEGIQCQNVEQLTFKDEQFNLCTSTEVFEHVADDKRGFAEIHRVLRPMGMLVFSVPLTGSESTLQRTRLVGDHIIHLEEPEYHGDAITGQGQVLAHRNYGVDILSLLLEVGFSRAWIDEAPVNYFHGIGRQIIVAQK